MNYRIRTFWLTGVMAITIIACAQTLYVPTQADSQKTGVSYDTLVSGRKLYVNYCSSCHSLYQPERFSVNKWKEIMPAMQKKAKCSEQDAAIIMKYINARAK